MSVSITFTIGGEKATDFKERIREEATKDGLSMSEWITEACADKLRGKG